MNRHLDHHVKHENCTYPSAGAGLYAGGSFRCALGESNAGVSEA